MNGDALYERRLREQQELVQPDPIKQIKSIQSQIPKAPQQGGYTVAMDFDGVLSFHRTGDPIDQIGPPLLPGIKLAKQIIASGHHLIVLTARPEQMHNTILGWLKGQGVKAYEVTNIKPPAAMYIDDRAIQWPMNYNGQRSRESTVRMIDEFEEDYDESIDRDSDYNIHEFRRLAEGGKGSGDKGHKGRPGERGGSGAGGGRGYKEAGAHKMFKQSYQDLTREQKNKVKAKYGGGRHTKLDKEEKPEDTVKILGSFKNKKEALAVVREAVKKSGGLTTVTTSKASGYRSVYGDWKMDKSPYATPRQSVFSRCGISVKDYHKYDNLLAGWILGEHFTKSARTISSASKEISSGNIHSVFGKCLAIDNAISRMKYGEEKQIRTYRGLSPGTAKEAIGYKKKGYDQVDLKVNPVISYTESKVIAGNFAKGDEGFAGWGGGRGIRLSTRTSSDDILLSYKTAKGVFKEAGYDSYVRQKEIIAMVPKGKIRVNLSRAKIMGESTRGKTIPVIDLTQEGDWLGSIRRKRHGNKKTNGSKKD